MILGVVSSLFSILPLEIVRFYGEQIETGSSTSLIRYFFIGMESNLDKYDHLILIFFFSSLIYIVIRNVYGYLTARITNVIINKIQNKLYKSLLDNSYKYHVVNSSSSSNYKLASDCQRLELIFSQPFYTALSDLFDLFWISIVLITISVSSFTILVITVPIIIIFSHFMARKQRTLFASVQDKESNKIERSYNVLQNIDSIKAFNTESIEYQKFYSKNKRILAKKNHADLILSLFFPIEGLLRFSALSIAVLLYVQDSNVTGTTLVALLAFGLKFYAPISNFNKYYHSFQSGLASAERILSTMDISHSEKSDLSDEVVISNVNRIDVDKVSITSDKTNIYYPNIQINKGEKIHLKGVSGRGKSLLAKCLLGLIDYLGDIRINGKIMSNHDLIALRKSITYVSQDPFILKASLVDNITYSLEQKPDQKEVSDIIKLLNLDCLAKKQQLQYETLSGGEKKRIALARALLSSKDIILLDEVNSNLDSKSKTVVEKLIGRRFLNKIIILISHSDINESGFKVVEI
jgi:ATP-binding cassette subfamily C protein